MKRALRSCETEMFFKSDADQTPSIEEAQSFESFEEAAAFSKKYRLKKTELVLRTTYPEQDVRIPIRESFPQPTIAKREVRPAANAPRLNRKKQTTPA
jgi:hypothetical protein